MRSIAIGNTTASVRRTSNTHSLCSVRDADFDLDLSVTINCGEHENDEEILLKFLRLADDAVGSLKIRESHPNNGNWWLLPDDVAYWACRNDIWIESAVIELEGDDQC